VSATTCAAVRELAAELALDVLDGDERAAALAHLQTCAGCRDEVASLTRAADELLLLAPEAAPAPGLEQRVLDRLADPTAADPTAADLAPALPRRAPGRRLLAVAATLVALALTATLALAARNPAPEAAGRTATMITTAGQVVGDVELAHDPDAVTVTIPDWVALVQTYGGTVEGPYWLMVRTAAGSHDLYRLPGADEHPWRVALDADPAAVQAVSVVDDAGRVWCTARFAA
jgi:Putative zinc-finger